MCIYRGILTRRTFGKLILRKDVQLSLWKLRNTSAHISLRHALDVFLHAILLENCADLRISRPSIFVKYSSRACKTSRARCGWWDLRCTPCVGTEEQWSRGTTTT